MTDGRTQGGYQLQIRLQETDEIAGSTIRYADIRYATNGIEAIGRTDAEGHYVITRGREADGKSLIAFARDRLPFSVRLHKLKPDVRQQVQVPDARLFPAAFVQFVPQVPHVPAFIRLIFNKLDPIVGDTHRESIVKPHAAFFLRQRQPRHAADIFCNGYRTRFDLMNQVNVRGTFLASQVCLPYLLKAQNPHILTFSPPLNLNPRWFKNHTAYTMAKYGMSMTVLGLAAEFSDQGVAVNALWPKTVIHTAALAMLGGLVDPKKCRTPQIMADSACAIIRRNSSECSGNFFIDEDVLQEEGISDFSSYAVAAGNQLFPDLFFQKLLHSNYSH